MTDRQSRAINSFLEFMAPDTESAELDRLLLRIYEDPALMSYLAGVGKSGENTELDFVAVPDNAVDAIVKLIGPVNVEVLHYEIHGRPHIGFRFNLKTLVSNSAKGGDLK